MGGERSSFYADPLSQLARLLLTVCLAALVWLVPRRAEAAKLPKEVGACAATGASLRVAAQVMGCVPYEAPAEPASLCSHRAQSRVVAKHISNAADEGSLSPIDAPCGPKAQSVRGDIASNDTHAPGAPSSYADSLPTAWLGHAARIPSALHTRELRAQASPAPRAHIGLHAVLSLERPPRA